LTLVTCYRGPGRRYRARAFNQFIEFASIEPDTSTLGEIVFLDILAIDHHKCGVRAGGALHGGSLNGLLIWLLVGIDERDGTLAQPLVVNAAPSLAPQATQATLPVGHSFAWLLTGPDAGFHWEEGMLLRLSWWK